MIIMMMRWVLSENTSEAETLLREECFKGLNHDLAGTVRRRQDEYTPRWREMILQDLSGPFSTGIPLTLFKPTLRRGSNQYRKKEKPAASRCFPQGAGGMTAFIRLPLPPLTLIMGGKGKRVHTWWESSLSPHPPHQKA